MVELVNLLFPGFGLVMLAGGVALVRKGRFYSRQSERVAETDISSADSLQPGTVAVQGTARVDDEEGTVTTALTGEEALVSQSSVTATKDDDDTDSGTGSHRQLHDETRRVSFLVEDDTGTVRVDPPERADLRLDENVVNAYSRRVPDAADLADDSRAAADGEVPVGNANRWRDWDRRYEQAAIVPGEEVYVLGEADSYAGAGPEFEVAGGERPERFIVSDESREDVQSGGKIGAYLSYAVGSVVGVLGALLLFGGLAAMLG